MDVSLVLNTIYTNPQYVLVGSPQTEEEYNEGLTWVDERPKPTWAEIEDSVANAEYLAEYEKVKLLRQAAYREESDYLFFYSERGQTEKQVWLDKVAEIDARLPYPTPPEEA